MRVVPKPGERERKWFKARVEDQVNIRSYKVRTEDGKLHRRNRLHLHQSKEPFSQATEINPIVPRQDNQSNTAATTAESVRPKTADPLASNNADGQPKQKEPATLPESQESRSESPSGPVKPAVIVTRSGRVSKAPKHLKDFVTVR